MLCRDVGGTEHTHADALNSQNRSMTTHGQPEGHLN